MNRDVKFRRNVYIILLSILLLAILIQVARSQFVLKFNHNEHWMTERERLLNAGASFAETTDAQGPAACLAYAGSEAVSVELKDNAARTLEYMKQPVIQVDVEEKALVYGKCSHVLFATGQLDSIGNMEGLDEYVHSGGAVFLMNGLETDDGVFSRLYRKFGILSFDFANLTQGIHLTSNVLIGEQGLKTGKDFISIIATSVDLDNESILMAESLDGVPIMWKRSYGAGSFTVYNGDNLRFKSNRGLIAGAFSMMQPDYIYPIFNAKVFYIDDFPAPITKELKPDIYRKYKMDMPGFYRDVWWPDMLKASKKYNLKYTAAVIETYNDQITPPFQNPIDAEYHNLIAYGREVLKSGGEISLHGYNHQSLQSNREIAKYFEYKPWLGQEDMELSVREAIRFVATAFPNYSVMSYVPPSNVLGLDGREALKQAWPDLTVIASLYDTDYENRAYVQEYEVSDDGIIELPRVTSGYLDDPYSRWLETNAITTVGVFSHFIHPDDLLDKQRSDNKDWEKLYEDFTLMLERLRETYPWLREMTSTEAGLAVAGTSQARVTWNKSSDRISGQIEGFTNEMHFVLRTDRKIGRQEHCSVQKIDDQTYLVKAHDARFAIGLGG
ncbi:DUF2194 domain-containing protein [Paenibacillus sp. LHD-117]|uniref:DUF2194 domain-containing protein n=1 Tax=Paenibacillus sp. LHD-117 TaxID=3071412 RepID=UPI0027DF4829|nr:DUF2194 domain-containing protein [Paenibacillus sp. LHD-117]MDQ6420726.1 DUF2194 domain-containing protein [Paenibacillus sp. LHD-117]